MNNRTLIMAGNRQGWYCPVCEFPLTLPDADFDHLDHEADGTPLEYQHGFVMHFPCHMRRHRAKN